MYKKNKKNGHPRNWGKRSWDKKIRHRATKRIWHKKNISERSCEDMAPKLGGDCAS